MERCKSCYNRVVHSMIRKKTIESTQDDVQTHTLTKTLNWWSLIGIGLGNVIGAGIFILTGVIARDKSGPAVVLSFVFSGIACVFSAFCYAELSNKVPGSGSSYTFCFVTMGEFIGWIMGWNVSMGMIVTVSAVTRGLVSYCLSILESFKIKVPVWLYEIGPMKGNLLSILVIIIFCALLCFGLKSFAVLNNIMLAATVFVIIFVIVAGFIYAEAKNWSPFFPYGVSGIFVGSSVAFYSYAGFECVVTCAEECKDQKRDIPIGLFGTLGVAIILYVGVSAAITLMVKYTTIDVSSPLSSAFTERGLRWMSTIIGVGAFFALLTSILTNLLGASRLFFSMARDNLLPPFMARINRRFDSPILSTIIIGVVACLLAFFMPLEELADIVSIGTLFAFALVCFCVLILRYKDDEDDARNKKIYIHLSVIFVLVLMTSFFWSKDLHLGICLPFTVLSLIACLGYFFYNQLNIPDTFKCPFVPLFPLLGIVLNLFMISTFTLKIWIYFFLSLVPAIFIYFFYGMHYSKLAQRTESTNVLLEDTNSNLMLDD